MIKDTTMEIFEEALQSVAEDMEKNGKAEADILCHFESKELSKVLIDSLEKMSCDIKESMERTMFEEVLNFRAEDAEFLARQEQKWGKCFVASEAMYLLILEVAEAYNDFVSEKDKEDIKPSLNMYVALKHIHGRALQQYLEVVTLMKNGFADGAYSRWRSMYELAVIASFIKENGEEVAKSYIEASTTTDRYDWAKSSGLFENKKTKHVTFNDIQKKCDLNSAIWKNQYDLANKIVHASPQGTFARLGNMNHPDQISVGRSDYGITTPAEHSALTLAIISSLFLTVYPYGDGLLAIATINRWIDVIRECYFRTHDEVFPDSTKRLWNTNVGRPGN